MKILVLAMTIEIADSINRFLKYTCDNNLEIKSKCLREFDHGVPHELFITDFILIQAYYYLDGKHLVNDGLKTGLDFIQNGNKVGIFHTDLNLNIPEKYFFLDSIFNLLKNNNFNTFIKTIMNRKVIINNEDTKLLEKLLPAYYSPGHGHHH